MSILDGKKTAATRKERLAAYLRELEGVRPFRGKRGGGGWPS